MGTYSFYFIFQNIARQITICESLFRGNDLKLAPAILLLIRSIDFQVFYLTNIIAMNCAKGGRHNHFLEKWSKELG